MTAILWLRRELRLTDNPALAAAMAGGRAVLPVYVLDDAAAGRWALGGASRWWLHHSLTALAESLRARGAPLVLRRGDTAAVLARLAGETGATEIHAGAAVEPWARAQIDALRVTLPVPLHLHPTITLLDPESVRTQAGGPYGVFTPFARACRALYEPPRPLPAPSRIPAPDTPPRSDVLDDWDLLPRLPDWAGGLRAAWTPGEDAARARLAAFVSGSVATYKDRRDRPDIDGTSRLSPHFAFGELSPHAAWRAAAAAMGDGPGVTTFQNELLWREFSANLLWHNPDLPHRPLRPAFAAMPWRDDPAGFRAWRRGRTGIPIVDAGLRQLWHTGWMHNRVRMVAASFLVKHLLLPWQLGEAWFWDTLVDADLASNAAQWQWVAGCGADAAPYFRIFNPVLQGLKFDPRGDYVRRFVPELANTPAAHVHAPWEAPRDLLSGGAYPTPIVDLAAGRQRALAALATITA